MYLLQRLNRLKISVSASATRSKTLDLKPIRTTNPDLWITYGGFLNLGTHHKNYNERLPNMVHFCDYASAGATWSQESFYRVWLPVEHSGPASF